MQKILQLMDRISTKKLPPASHCLKCKEPFTEFRLWAAARAADNEVPFEAFRFRTEMLDCCNHGNICNHCVQNERTNDGRAICPCCAARYHCELVPVTEAQFRAAGGDCQGTGVCFRCDGFRCDGMFPHQDNRSELCAASRARIPITSTIFMVLDGTLSRSRIEPECEEALRQLEEQFIPSEMNDALRTYQIYGMQQTLYLRKCRRVAEDIAFAMKMNSVGGLCKESKEMYDQIYAMYGSRESSFLDALEVLKESGLDQALHGWWRYR